ncbi:hypothetical protein WA1_50075 [Scytonema hofmannii PCC 7110]|uniref:EamA domain-containing protein n=1 Tax=Scytonema hofmannii PCC 7110 TaxID=128403 RepID=A0A139WR25_9CYAN|nr:EamA family transporter [Scytonema hofmannii]KYC34878.1 hypothetical protein WA1_50075 [Scytonema hofmannii PCC 7110]
MKAGKKIGCRVDDWESMQGCAFLSTYLGFWLQQISLKFTAAGIAKSLGATSPLFVLPLAFFIGEKISLRAILGVLVASAGVELLFIYR